jgi:hypothetical protein
MTDTTVETTPNSINKMIKSKMIKKLDSGLWIQLKNVHDKKREDGTCWNRRDMSASGTLEHIAGITKHLSRDGILPAVEVQAHPESGVVKIDGYCRTEAYRNVDASGEGEIWLPIIQFKGDELDCLARIESSNRDRKLTPLEQLDLYKSTRDELIATGLKGTLAEIAHVMNVSRQYVDQILKLGALDAEGKALVSEGKVTAAQAVKAVREGAEAATAALKTKAVENKEKAGPKAPQVAPSLLSDLFQMTGNIRRSLSPEVHAVAAGFLKGERKATDMVSIEVGHLARLMALQDEGERQLEAKASKAKAKAEAANQEPIELPEVPVDSIPADVQAKLDSELAHVDLGEQLNDDGQEPCRVASDGGIGELALVDLDPADLGGDWTPTDADLQLKDDQERHESDKEQEDNNQFAFLG